VQPTGWKCELIEVWLTKKGGQAVSLDRSSHTASAHTETVFLISSISALNLAISLRRSGNLMTRAVYRGARRDGRVRLITVARNS
jgi:hypothetical protein